MPKHRHIEIIARGALRQGQSILLCKNIETGYYYLPGGHVEFGEPAAVAVAREFLEETGLVIKVGLLGLVHEAAFDAHGKPHHEVNLVFHVERMGAATDPGTPIQSQEPDIAFEWVDGASLADVDVRPAAAKAWLMAGGRAGGPPEWVSTISESGLSSI